MTTFWNQIHMPMNLEVALLLSPSSKAFTISGEQLFVIERHSSLALGDVPRLVIYYGITMVRGPDQELEGTLYKEDPPAWVTRDWGIDLNACIWHPIELLFSQLT